MVNKKERHEMKKKKEIMVRIKEKENKENNLKGKKKERKSPT